MMNTLFKKTAIGLALAATAMASATPAMARDGHRGGGDDVGVAIVGGIVGLAIGAAIASGSHNDRDDRYYDGYDQGGVYYNNGGGYYNNGYNGGGYYNNGYNYRNDRRDGHRDWRRDRNRHGHDGDRREHDGDRDGYRDHDQRGRYGY